MAVNILVGFHLMSKYEIQFCRKTEESCNIIVIWEPVQ